MALDGVFLSQLTKEIADIIVGGRVDKIHQPAREIVVIAMRAKGGNQKLLLCASASNPRMHFTSLPQDNPKSPPMFCMLMRKHLTGAKLIEVKQLGLDRVVHFKFETTNELGDRVILTLATEIMGRHSNIILIDQNNHVIDAIKRVTDEMSRVRPILPGISYTLAPATPRLNIFTATPSEIAQRVEETPDDLAKALSKALEGMSPLVCREIAFQAHADRVPLNEEQRTRLKFYLSRLTDLLNNNKAQPTMLLDTTSKPKDFSYLDIHQYGHNMIGRKLESYSKLLDTFYSERDRIDKIHQRSADLFKLLVNLNERLTRKLAAQRDELQASTERDKLKIYGDLLSSNLHLLERGMKFATVENYYEEGRIVEIPLDIMRTPAQNAQKYYSAYRKADTAEKKLRTLIEQGESELIYLDTVFDELTRASLESELVAIRSELASQGYVKNTIRRGMKEEKLPPLRYISDDGYTIYCGRNNLQNDRLTLKDSRKNDIWFHTQKIPGSHVIVISQGEKIPDRTLEQAAIIAACHSKASGTGKVAVDYTEIRNVWKHPSGKPGLVLYEPYTTAVVEADETLIQQLAHFVTAL